MLVPAWMMNQKYAVLADWMGALSAAAAAVVAVGIALWSNRREDRRRQKERDEQRRNDSMLGVAILGGLIEEIKQGCCIMRFLAEKTKGDLQAAEAAGGALEMDMADLAANFKPIQYTEVSSLTPAASGTAEAPSIVESTRGQYANPVPQMPISAWEGMGTIPDNVLLRIIAVSKGVTPKGFPFTNIRVPCNNYFTYICEKVNVRVRALSQENGKIAGACPDSQKLHKLLCGEVEDGGGFIKSTQKVLLMLEQAKELLMANARADRPDPK